VITIDDEGNARQGALLMSDDVTVYADPVKQIEEDVRTGEKSYTQGLGEATTITTEAYGTYVAKTWVAGAAASGAGAGAGALWAGAGLRGAVVAGDVVGGATFGGTSAALDGGSAEEILTQAGTGAVLGPVLGRVARGASIGQTGTVMEPLSAVRPTTQQGRLRELHVGPYEETTTRGLGTVGDRLTGDHIPSFAAVRRNVEKQLGRRLTGAEAEALRSKTTTITVPEHVHRSSSPTYGGRNTPAQIDADSANLAAAAQRDAQALSKAMAKEGKDPREIQKALDKLHQANREGGIY
jgi:hypothetical protein